MGWKIITNNKDKWEIFSSITDSIIFECGTQQELLNHIAFESIYDGKLKAIKRLMLYPHGWTVNDEILLNKEGNISYYEWYSIINSESKTYEEYYEKIDEKLDELLNLNEVNKNE